MAVLFELALGLSAWKQYSGTRWALRCNPSSGNLHPTEGYAILPDLPGLKRASTTTSAATTASNGAALCEGRAAELLAESLPPGSFLVGLSSIHWREAWKYGERAFRYCQHDAGHALAAVRYAAAALGWSARLLAPCCGRGRCRALGPGPAQRLRGHCRAATANTPTACCSSAHAIVLERAANHADVDMSTLRAVLQAGTWAGRANPLSPAHVHWPVIDDVAEATWQKDRATDARRVADAVAAHEFAAVASSPSRLPAATLFDSSGSAAVAWPSTATPRSRAATFYAHARPPAAAARRAAVGRLAVAAALHLGIFRPPRPRPAAGPLPLRAKSDGPRPAAVRPPCRLPLETSEGLPGAPAAVRLVEGDLREQAQVVSCHQDIAADGAFSLGMIAEFAREHPGNGGMVVSAAVLGSRRAGAGAVPGGGGGRGPRHRHRLLLRRRLPRPARAERRRFQDLYHFTLGGPVDDPRLMTMSAYFHLDGARLEADIRVPRIRTDEGCI